MMTPQAWPRPRELLWLWMNPSHRALLSLPSVKWDHPASTSPGAVRGRGEVTNQCFASCYVSCPVGSEPDDDNAATLCWGPGHR